MLLSLMTEKNHPKHLVKTPAVKAEEAQRNPRKINSTI
jgi:hypothetical protein